MAEQKQGKLQFVTQSNGVVIEFPAPQLPLPIKPAFGGLHLTGAKRLIMVQARFCCHRIASRAKLSWSGHDVKLQATGYTHHCFFFQQRCCLLHARLSARHMQ